MGPLVNSGIKYNNLFQALEGWNPLINPSNEPAPCFPFSSLEGMVSVEASTPLSLFPCANLEANSKVSKLASDTLISPQNGMKNQFHIDEELIDALKKNDPEKVRLLLGLGANKNIILSAEITLLHMAAVRGYVDIAQLLIAEGANINAKTIHGATPLHEAAEKGHFNMTKFLLDAGAKVNETSRSKATPLHWAAYQGHLAIVKLLISKGADTQARTLKGVTPFKMAKNRRHAQVACFLDANC